MPASQAQRAATAIRRGQAIQMALAGADYETIANRLGYASRGAAHTDISRALEASLTEQHRSADVLRHAELLRLDRLQAAVWAEAVRGELGAANFALKVIDRRCRLLGLDAPQRHEVVTLDEIDAEIRRLTVELDGADGSVETGTATGAAAPAQREG